MEESSASAPSFSSQIGEEDDSDHLAQNAYRLIGQGEISSALHFLNKCLDEKKVREKTIDDDHGERGSPLKQGCFCTNLSPEKEVSLLEKRCLIHMKLHHFEEVVDDARRILDKRTNHALAYKCLLVSLCKTNRVRYLWISIL